MTFSKEGSSSSHTLPNVLAKSEPCPPLSSKPQNFSGIIIIAAVCICVFSLPFVRRTEGFLYFLSHSVVAIQTFCMILLIYSRRKLNRSGSFSVDSEGNQPSDLIARTVTAQRKKKQRSGKINGRKIGKLSVSSREIAKGSNGTIVVEGTYEGRPVAVKRLVKAYHLSYHNVAYKEHQNLSVSDSHSNIVRLYGVEEDQDFVYLALERCTCNLNDFIPKPTVKERLEGTLQLWTDKGYPLPILFKLMRDMVSGLVHLHELGMVHRDLKPQNVLILKKGSLCAKLSDMGISKRLVGDKSSLGDHATGCGSSGWQAPEQLLNGRQTRAVDVFSLGLVLFYCITGGEHPFGGDPLKRDSKIVESEADLFLVEYIPEAVDLFSRSLDRDAELRPKASEVFNHPLFWDSDMRLSFLRDVSDRVELEDRVADSDILTALESIAPLVLGTKRDKKPGSKWDKKMEPSRWDKKINPALLSNIGNYRRYKYDSVRDLLRLVRNKLNHYRELPLEIQEVLGPVPEGFDGYFRSWFPKLLMEVYKVLYKYCREEEVFNKYFKGSVV